MEKNLVSIIVPVYNAENFLEASVNTLLLQTYSNIEVVLIDDGSIDGSLEKCNEIASRDSRCRVIHKENKGVSHTRNIGIQESRGEYIMFFDSDDFLEKDAVETCVAQIQKDRTDAVFFGMFFDTYRNGTCIKQVPRSVLDDEIIYKEELCNKFVSLVRNNYISSVWNKLIKKSVLIDNHVEFNVDLANYEDYLFSLQLLEFLESVSVITNPLYHYVRQERVGLSRRYVEGYDEKIEILISEADSAFYRLGFTTEEANQYKGSVYIYWMTLVLMNYAKETASFKKRALNIKNYINNSAVKKRFKTGRTANKYAKLLRFFAHHNMAKFICLLCLLKLKYKEKNY